MNDRGARRRAVRALWRELAEARGVEDRVRPVNRAGGGVVAIEGTAILVL